jgi:hypothetical protein
LLKLNRMFTNFVILGSIGDAVIPARYGGRKGDKIRAKNG